MRGGKGTRANAVPIFCTCSFAFRRWASGKRESVKDVPRYPPGRGSSWVKEPIGQPAKLTCASLALSASFLSRLREIS